MPVLDRFVDEFDGEMRTLAVASLDNLWQRMRGEFLDRWLLLQRQELPAAELEREMEAFLAGLSEKYEADLARQSVGVAVNEGRDMLLKSAAVTGEARYAVRSEVLDENTCGPCQVLDSQVYEIGSALYTENLPPAKCDGGARCRGFMVAVTEGLA